MLERIAKLLNQAENAGTEAEAAVFMAKAQQLASLHSIDLARARHATIAKQRTKPVQRTVHIGKSGSRGLRTICDLYLGIAHANDIRCTIAHDASQVYSVGFAEDLDVADAMFASLQVQQAKALDEFKRRGDWQHEKVWVERGWDGGWRPQTWLTARLNFQAAFADRIEMRLWEAKRAEERRIASEEADRQARLHIDGDDLSEHFKQWFFDAHGLDLDADDSTAQEMRHGFLGMRIDHAGGIFGLVMPDSLDEAEWLAELLNEYVRACESQADNDSTALVLVEKRDALDEAYAPLAARARGKYRGGTAGAHSRSGRDAGAAAGSKASLGGSTAIGGVKGAISA